MGKMPASLFYWGDFVRDPDLRRCTHAEVGIWIRILCLMFEAEFKGMLSTNDIPWTDEEIARAVGGNPKEVRLAVTALVTKGVASRADNGALVNRRMYREHEQRLGTRKRVEEFRAREREKRSENDTVTHDVTPCTETEYETSSPSTETLDRKTTTSAGESTEQQEEVVYHAYPRKVGHGPAIKAIRSAVVRLATGSLHRQAMDPTEARRWLWKRATEYAKSPAGAKPDGQDYRPHPATWFNGERYLDDDSEWTGKANGKTEQRRSGNVERVANSGSAWDGAFEDQGSPSPIEAAAEADVGRVSTSGSGAGNSAGMDPSIRGAGTQARDAESRGSPPRVPDQAEILSPSQRSERGS